MAIAVLPISAFPGLPNCFLRKSRNTQLSALSSTIFRLDLIFSRHFPSIRFSKRRRTAIRAAYVTAPASDPNFEGVYASESTSSAPAVDSSALISMGKIWRLLMLHKLRITAAVLALFGCTSCTLSMPIFSGRFFEVLVGARPDPLWQLLTQVGCLYVFEPIFTVVFVTNMNTVWEKVMASMRARVFRRILIQKVEFFDRYKVGELTGLVTSDLGFLKDIVSENVSRDRGLRAFSEIVGTICILFTLSPQLAPVLGPLMFSISLLVAIYRKSTVPIFKSHGLAQASISNCVNETLSAIRTVRSGILLISLCVFALLNVYLSQRSFEVRSFGGEKRQISMFSNLVFACQASGIKLGTLKSANETLTRVMVYISLLALYCLGGSKVKAGELTIGTMASFVGYTFTLTFAVQGLVNTLGDLRGTLAAVERINLVLSGSDIDVSLAYGLEREINNNEQDDEKFQLLYKNVNVMDSETPNAHSLPTLKSLSNGSDLAWCGDICLEDVHFSYPLRPDVEVLSGLDLTLKCGTITALVGSSGSGKSTTVQLLARFYEPTKGRITVGGEDVRMFDKREWAQFVSIVNQEPVLFSVSVGENIAYGLPDENVSKEDVVKAAKAANAHDFIISLPQSYETPVGEHGGLLSGGQRQRIAIARALLKNSPILILDEATSALDAVSEQLVQEALNLLMKGRTTLIIAHRLSTVQNADQIAVCSGGKIAELGTHSELLTLKGQYASLVGTQRLAFE